MTVIMGFRRRSATERATGLARTLSLAVCEAAPTPGRTMNNRPLSIAIEANLEPRQGVLLLSVLPPTPVDLSPVRTLLTWPSDEAEALEGLDRLAHLGPLAHVELLSFARDEAASRRLGIGEGFHLSSDAFTSPPIRELLAESLLAETAPATAEEPHRRLVTLSDLGRSTARLLYTRDSPMPEHSAAWYTRERPGDHSDADKRHGASDGG
jgi:hypothetical protein